MNTPDICEAKHKMNAESVQANQRAGHFKATLRTEIYSYLRMDKPRGATCAELAQHFNRPIHSLSGRISELKSLGMVRATDEIRDRGRVVVADVHWMKQQSMF